MLIEIDSSNGTDYFQIDNDALNFAIGYLQTDLTGNKFVDATDFAIEHNNSSRFVTIIGPLISEYSKMIDSRLQILERAIGCYSFPAVAFDFKKGEEIKMKSMLDVEKYIRNQLCSQELAVVKDGLSNVTFLGKL